MGDPSSINLPYFLTLSASLCPWLAGSFRSHLHIHSDPQLFVYFWIVWLGARCADCVWQQQQRSVGWGSSGGTGRGGGGFLICSPRGCNHALGFIRWAGVLFVRPCLELPAVCTNRPILEHSVSMCVLNCALGVWLQPLPCSLCG